MDKYEQKAFDLVNKFYFILPNNGYINSGTLSCKNRWEEARKCALICLDELISSAAPHCWECGGGNREFFEKVKIQILKHKS